MSKPWPPPPDIDSIQELVAAADVEGFIAGGAPADEYETEGEGILAAIENFPTSEITVEKLTPVIQSVWREAFSLGDAMLMERETAIKGLAAQIARFFGPEAKPQVRGS